ncbi:MULTISPECIES: type I methionyl aminopeptidase [unclassified Candidatus Frackibacter]|uniref:type I methionyl aminopeptidase n=1 Tax=unclassified Candidatus Frackibacter TaxID=2648818 RepID=UPI00079353D5|nr:MULTISPECIES: type I methionyl aminopeptidase [unclassified Candidatus Frackibacter]KXS45786.1 MAG: methionyl aminopeptidase [Candidatus Frackibacter sp. T328-2]SDC22514.1 methionine aminopeptidase, type I [Candidatus Frackibacter sp. WG11]SEM49379.1 methionine aminopeptidase, type I [Candidatus Frackibacter sp. WG12]SFL50919.1 methionine aminopeptidase, type I [Candidatus Frackibacter sp. WG13]
MIIRKSERELALMRDAGRIVAETHAYLAEEVTPGITTEEIDRMAEEFILKHDAKPAFKGYQGFPSTVCVAINEQVVHGIPDSRRLKSGEIIGLDIGAIKSGYYGDAAQTLAVGEVSDEAQRLMRVTKESLLAGIEAAVEGNRLSDISHAVQSHVEAAGFSVVRNFVGHGIGSKMHEAPQLPNFGAPGNGPILKSGMTLAIEPMVNVGDYRVETLDDGWTVVTKDRELSAHFEHTVAITESGPQILTKI